MRSTRLLIYEQTSIASGMDYSIPAAIRRRTGMNPLKELLQHGQSVWLDSISRDLVKSGELRRLVAEEGLRGLTSNPTIFEQAIGQGKEYDDALRQLLRNNERQTEKDLFEALAVEDIRMAADELRPVYD